MTEVDILLVEDDPDDTELTLHGINSNLELLSKKIFHASDGSEALNFVFARDKFEGSEIKQDLKLIIVDLKLPKVNGLEVLEEIRSHQLTKNIPIIMFTSSKEKKDIATAYGLGVNSYVVKPLIFDDYIKTVAMMGEYWMKYNQRLF